MDSKELIIVELDVPDGMSWKDLKKNIKAGVEKTGAVFLEISTWAVPNRYDLTDPDVIPDGFK